MIAGEALSGTTNRATLRPSRRQATNGGSMRRGFMGGVMVLLTSCGAAAQVAMAPQSQDAAGKQFSPPPAGMAAVYFYNPLTTGPVINVFEGPVAIGQLGPMTWMRIETSPGWHAMRCVTPDAVNPTSIIVAPGDMRFVEVDRPPGAPVCTIQEAGTDAGRAGVLAGSRALQPQ
jgi:hypothetical protein